MKAYVKKKNYKEKKTKKKDNIVFFNNCLFIIQ
jgi:hypothetical protein